MDNPPPPAPPGPGDLPPPQFVQPPAPPGDPAAAAFSYTPAPYYGGFWLRFVAYVIDSFIVAIPSWIVGTIVGVAGAMIGTSIVVGHAAWRGLSTTQVAITAGVVLLLAVAAFAGSRVKPKSAAQLSASTPLLVLNRVSVRT